MQTAPIADVRSLGTTDVPAALQLSSLAGWNQTADDWRLLLRVAPEGCFGISVGDTLAGTATLLRYGTRLGWIGMVLTHPDFRRRGFAKRLLAHCLDQADALEIRTLKLDATEQGQPLYAALGFIAEQPIERWTLGVPHTSEQRLRRPVRETASGSLDLSAFGAERSDLLAQLGQLGDVFAQSNGHLLSRPGRMYRYLGPCVAGDSEAARNLVQRGLTIPGEKGWAWDLLPGNRNAVALANELGFRPQRQLVCMRRGEEMRTRDDLVYAVAGFEFG